MSQDFLQSTWKTEYEKSNNIWTSTAATTEFVCKIPNRKKVSNKHFNLCEAKICLDEIIKPVNSETINLQVMMALRPNFIDTFQMDYLLSF